MTEEKCGVKGDLGNILGGQVYKGHAGQLGQVKKRHTGQIGQVYKRHVVQLG